MNKIIKILLIGFLIIIISGCSGNYNLIINKDKSISEELDITIKNENNAYQKTLNIFEENNIDKDKYKVSVVDNEVKINYKDSFTSIEDYILNSKIYHQLFDNIQYNKKDDNISLYVNENLKLKNNINNLNGTNLNDIDIIQINITNPFKVSNNNAEIINERVYTWSIKNTDIEKEINMEFKDTLDEFPYRAVIVGSLIFVVVIIFGIRLLRRYKKTQRF